jgi:hypothetical protein
MITCQNELTENEVQFFKDYWNNNQDSVCVNGEQDGKILDRRLTISDKSAGYKIIERIVNKYFPTVDEFWSGYQRQNFAHNIHIDDYGIDQEKFVYTFVFSLHTEPRFKTYIWQEKCHSNQALHDFVANWGTNKKHCIKKTNISQQEDLEHTYDQNQEEYMCDYLEVDGIYSYQSGSGALFSAKQLHCTSNWTKYQDIPYRDLLQIHVVTSCELDI